MKAGAYRLAFSTLLVTLFASWVWGGDFAPSPNPHQKEYSNLEGLLRLTPERDNYQPEYLQAPVEPSIQYTNCLSHPSGITIATEYYLQALVQANGTIHYYYDFNGDGKKDIGLQFPEHWINPHPLRYMYDVNFDGKVDIVLQDMERNGLCQDFKVVWIP